MVFAGRTPICQLPLAADCPGSCDEGDRAVVSDGQIGADAIAQSGPAVLAEGHRVAGGWALPPEEWRPVVVEVAEQRRHVNGACLNSTQPGFAEEAGQVLRLAEGPEALPLVQLARARIECHGRVPELAHQLHSTAVVPDVGRHRASWPAHTRHLRDYRGW